MAFNKTQQYNAYNMASQTVPKTRQIVMLYDGAIRFSQQAKQAMEENRIEDRYNLLLKVSEILMGLQAALDFDHGGEIAPLLYDYYSSLDARVLYIQRKNDPKVMESIISELKQMRNAWGEVDTRLLNAESTEQPAEETDSDAIASATQQAESTTTLSSPVSTAPSSAVFVSV